MYNVSELLLTSFIMFMHGHGKCCEGLKFDMDNKGEKLVITISGEKDKISMVEKKLKALKTLCCDDEGCCG